MGLAMAQTRKIFRIESYLDGRRETDAASDPGQIRHTQIMRELGTLRSLLHDRPDPSQELVLIRREMAEAMKIKAELDLVQEAILRTKREIASLHKTGFEGPEMRRVTGELDAIVGGTETATEQILTAAEIIDEHALHLQAAVRDEHAKAMATEIQERVVTIFEACNFQDLTGQRITKVVGVLQFIEERIVRMMEIWGGLESFRDIAAEERPSAEGDRALLNGPALDGDAGRASQDEIDALFG